MASEGIERPDPLLDQHRRLLDFSAINSGIACSRGYFSASAPKTLAQLGFSHAQQKNVPALVIPLWNVHGAIAFHQARPDHPRIRSGKPVKYETPPRVRMAIDVHPASRGSLADPTVPLIVTEGIRKADSALSHGAVAIGLLGVWNWRGTNEHDGKAALGDWEAVALNDREVFLCFDSDASEKPAVRLALDRLAEFLASRGSLVRVAQLHANSGTKVGLDDYLASGGDLQSLLRNSIPAPNGNGFAGKDSPEGGELPFTPLVTLLGTAPEEPDWRVRGYLTTLALTLVAGRPKVGKSTTVMALIAAVVRGESFLGCETTATGVLLLTEERRDTLAEKARALQLVSLRQDEVPKTPERTFAPVHVLMRHDAGTTPWPEVVREAIAYCDDQELGVFVVDTFDRWTGLRGDAENAAGAVNEALEPLQYAAAAGLAVLLVSHQRKSSGEYGDAVRGSNALTGGVDIVVELERPPRSLQLDSHARVLRAISRFTSTPDELHFELADYGFRLIDPEQKRADSERARILDDVDSLSTTAEIAERLDIAERTVRHHLKGLVDDGLAERIGAGKRNDPYRWVAIEDAQ